jgi:hypothetical protein
MICLFLFTALSAIRFTTAPMPSVTRPFAMSCLESIANLPWVMEEVQSAYWNQSMVTIRLVVIYYKSIEDGKETLHHKSFTIISDELSHTASTVFLHVLVVYESHVFSKL